MFCHEISVVVPPQGVNPNREISTLKVQDSNAIWTNFGPTISHLHANPINQMVAVRFDDYRLTRPTCDLQKQFPNSCLGTGMKMHFRLLQKKNLRYDRRPQEIDDHRQSLTHAIAHVDQIAIWPLGAFPPLSHKNLEWPSCLSPEISYHNVVKKTSTSSKILK